MDLLSDVIAGNARAERARRRLRQIDVATHMGISVSSLSDLESGKRRVSVDEIVPLCLALGIGFEKLIREIDADSRAALGL